MAREGARLVRAGVSNVNSPLMVFMAGRYLEAVKGQRKSTLYRSLVEESRSGSGSNESGSNSTRQAPTEAGRATLGVVDPRGVAASPVGLVSSGTLASSGSSHGTGEPLPPAGIRGQRAAMDSTATARSEETSSRAHESSADSGSCRTGEVGSVEVEMVVTESEIVGQLLLLIDHSRSKLHLSNSEVDALITHCRSQGSVRERCQHCRPPL